MPQHAVVSREEWLAARKELLEEEQKHAQRSEELAERRSELPSVRVDKEYTFDTGDGQKTPKGRQDEFRAIRSDEYPEVAVRS